VLGYGTRTLKQIRRHREPMRDWPLTTPKPPSRY